MIRCHDAWTSAPNGDNAPCRCGDGVRVHDPRPMTRPVEARVVMVGSDARDMGKTTAIGELAARLAALGHTVWALKIEWTIGSDIMSVVEEDPKQTKDSVRREFDMGCSRVVWLRVSEDRFAEAVRTTVDAMTEALPEDGILFVESNAARTVIRPSRFLHIVSATGSVKASARRTRRLADWCVRGPLTSDMPDWVARTLHEDGPSASHDVASERKTR